MNEPFEPDDMPESYKGITLERVVFSSDDMGNDGIRYFCSQCGARSEPCEHYLWAIKHKRMKR